MMLQSPLPVPEDVPAAAVVARSKDRATTPAVDFPKSWTDRSGSLSPYLWMLLGSLSFALMGTLVHALTESCDWQVIALVRSGLAMIFAAGLALWAGARLVVWRPRTLWLRSIAGSISLVCTFFALTRLPVSDVLTLTNTFPIWVALLSWPLLRERPSRGVWLSVACGVVGIVLIQRPHLAEGNFATFLALGSSFSTAVAMIGLHRLRKIDTRAIVAHFSAVSFIFCLAALFFFERNTPSEKLFASRTLVMLLGVGVSATIGQLSLTKAFASGPPARVAVIGLTQIVFAMGFDTLLWDQSFHAVTLIGIALVIASTAWVMRKPARKDT
jgi:drug/metabolite transporter (DMT)-like permease